MTPENQPKSKKFDFSEPRSYLPNAAEMMDAYKRQLKQFIKFIKNEDNTINDELAKENKNEFEEYFKNNSYMLMYIVRTDPNITKTILELMENYSYDLGYQKKE